MKLLVLPPHRDVTLIPEAPEGWHLVDVARDFCRRILSDAAMTEASEAREAAPATAESMRELLLLRAARTLSTREERGGNTGLRALGAVLTALSGPPNGVRLRLDDLELEEGTTERSADVLRAVGQPAPYAEDLARAAERFTEAERVRLWLERDQQLPATAWLARACPPEVVLEVAGPFAVAHRKVLSRLPMLQRAVFVDATAPLRWRVAPLTGAPGPESLVWIPEALDLCVTTPWPPDDGRGWVTLGEERGPKDLRALTAGQEFGVCTPDELRGFTGGAPWGGHVELDSLVHADALVASGCRVAVVGFCAARGEDVLDTFGGRLHSEELARGAERLRAAGVRVVAEWWVGAPGVDTAMLESTLAALDAKPLFHHMAGVRPFHWPMHQRHVDRRFRWRIGQLRNPAADRDLARSWPFDAPATLSGFQLQEMLTALSTRLMQRAPLNPGRVAAAYLHGPTRAEREPPAEEGSAARAPGMGSQPLRLDDDCALLQLPAALDGAPKPTWYAANLRTGTVLAMDARLAPKLAGLTRPAHVADVLGAVPEAQRGRLVDTLVAKSVLTRVHG
ncbi:hypothetical protein [Myxococcus sp. RHSTA-1-4]|uniref:hypothetical protein n=1 Tax=Myxococcus sp. RHSTA-1-4 TaxID=2874601 RepID=UPI001CBD1070|nr:hypothetical protein [Myxococcus sp. RHSTA-1-4]MBZ4417823.1 hypothetical protein [Myxococcus sp. RHSTA-1-4]